VTLVSPDEITLDQLMSEIREMTKEEDPGSEYLSAVDWAKRWQRGLTQTRAVIRTLVGMERMVRMTRKCMAADGRMTRTPVYAIMEEKK
jgi:hypothetical protein